MHRNPMTTTALAILRDARGQAPSAVDGPGLLPCPILATDLAAPLRAELWKALNA